jgi:hypothetical protein
MNALQTELFDLALLKVLDANRTRYGLSAAAMGHLTVEFGFPNPDPEELLDRLDYLTAKKLVEEVNKLIGKANRAWRISEAGMQFIDGR